MSRAEYKKSIKTIRGFGKKILIINLLFILCCSINISFQSVKAEEETLVHTYICQGDTGNAYEGGSTTNGGFDNDVEFTSTDYTQIDSNDENYVEDQSQTQLEYQYHRFDFPIEENINDITKIDITWRGEGGRYSPPPNPPSYNENFSFWVLEDENYYNKVNGTDLNTFTISYTSNIPKMLKTGSLKCGAQSNFRPDPIHTHRSYIRSYYIEVDITYTSTTTTTPQLDIDFASPVEEGDSFTVDVTSGGLPIEDVLVNFSGESDSTNALGEANFIAPYLTTDTSYDITAYKEGYNSAQSSITITNNDTQPVEESQLVINAPTQVLEENSFTVEVSADSLPIADVLVNFSDISKNTDVNGEVTFNAPSVIDDTSYDITAYLTGYLSDIKTIIVRSQEELSDGYVFGTVVDEQGNLLNEVKICVILPGENSAENCIFSDDQGEYNMSLSDGTYSVTASKKGYETNTISGVTVQTNLGSEVDFILQKSEESKPKTLVEYTINEEIIKGSIIGEVDLSTEDEQITLYSDFNVDIASSDINSEEGINIIVSGEGPPGRIVFYLGTLDGRNPDDLIIKYDGSPMEQSSDVEAFFNGAGGYITMSSEEESVKKYIVVIDTDFSTHEIEIFLKEIAEPFGGIMALAAYLIFAIIAVVVTTAHMKYVWKK